jgi:serine/threonine-protein kinase HipA
LEKVGKKKILLLRRFDRYDGTRIPYVSSMSMLGAKDNEQRSYLEIADVLRQHSGRLKEDMHRLWRRIVFNILISNTDDHLRNHGFLYMEGNGWRLSPAYDLNPVPVDIKPRILSTSIDLNDATASLELALEVAPYFEVEKNEANQIIHEVGAAASTWRAVSSNLGIASSEIDRMASAFEHTDLRKALGKTK